MDNSKASMKSPGDCSISEKIFKLHTRNTKDNSLIRANKSEAKNSTLKFKNTRAKRGLKGT